MKTLTFIGITLLSGAIAGTILGVINQGIVEPFVEQAIELESQNAQQSGEIINPIEFANYRNFQKGGEIAAGTILGLSFGALFGLVFACAHPHLPGSIETKRALVLGGIMWLVIFLMPALKYPANPPAVGDPETIYYRQGLYLAFVSISGLAALGLGLLHVRMPKSRTRAVAIPAAYAAIMAGAFFLMPSNPDAISAPMDLVSAFRIASGFTMSVFWAALALVTGLFWEKLKPHKTAKLSLS